MGFSAFQALGLLSISHAWLMFPVESMPIRLDEPEEVCTAEKHIGSKSLSYVQVDYARTRAESLNLTHATKRDGEAVDVMLCVPAFSIDRLNKLWNSWLEGAIHTPGIRAEIFMPRGTDTAKVLHSINVTLLDDWHGDKATFQAAMSKAIVPCAKKALSPHYYAVLDDDVRVEPVQLLAWLQQLQRPGHSQQHEIWGRKGCCGIVYGGFLLMSGKTVNAILGEDMNELMDFVTVMSSGFVCYPGARFMVDHFFSLAVKFRLGGSVHETSRIQEGFTSTWAVAQDGPVVAQHHVKDQDFLENIRMNQVPALRLLQVHTKEAHQQAMFDDSWKCGEN